MLVNYRFMDMPDVPSGLEVMQHLQIHPVKGVTDAKYVAVVGRETHADGEYWHVKLRVLDGQSRPEAFILRPAKRRPNLRISREICTGH